MNKTVIGVRFKDVGKVYYFSPGDAEIEMGDGVIVETVRGVEFGEVVLAPREMKDDKIVKPLKSIIKKAETKDYEKLEKNKKKEEEAFGICLEKIKKHNMEMKLINVEYTFDGNKIIFYFTADGRVDFRELVKDLAGVFKTRIELRQIGVRDEAKMLGGLGPCGRPCCCSQFLGDFQPVSIRMAKEQNLSLSPTKISGLCGRLMCCLNYENAHYKALRKLLPKVGSVIHTEDGDAEVVETNAITESVMARITLPDNSVEVKKYTLRDIQGGTAGGSEEEDIEIDDDMKTILDET
jgi:cell fate regulator YaaT (PSP1 superfamily)